MNIFYSNNINKSNKRIIILNQENSHLIKVLRKKTGDNVNITDGKGFLYSCSIIGSDKNKTRVLRTSSNFRKSTAQKHRPFINFLSILRSYKEVIFMKFKIRHDY